MHSSTLAHEYLGCRVVVSLCGYTAQITAREARVL
jgi:hypothetical protein